MNLIASLARPAMMNIEFHPELSGELKSSEIIMKVMA